MFKSKRLQEVLATMMAVVMVLSLSSVAYATETEIYSISVEANEQNGTVSANLENALEGDTVTVNAEAKDGYVLTQVAYRTIAENGTVGKTTVIEADEAGNYMFTMPASNIEVGAAFQSESDIVLYNSTSSNGGVIGGSRDTDYSVYISNWDVYVNVGDDNATVYLTFDKRYLDIEGIYMNLEIRQYGEGGYKSVGSVTYDSEELKSLVEEVATETNSTYVINSIDIPVAEGKSYEADLYQYCVVQFGCPKWVDSFDNEIYRWTYTGVDATILAEGVTAPAPIVWLYNLDANSYRGATVREILEELGVEAGTINNENLNQNIGYLVQWEGYEAVENPYNSEEYDVEYMLMGNLSDVQLDLLLEAMNENNIYVALKSIPTAWTASKTFSDLFEIMAEESEVLHEAVALDKMIYTAETLDEDTYDSSEYWDEFQTEITKALEALKTNAEETEEGADLYRNARLALEALYLKVTNKSYLEGNLELILEKQDNGTYKVTAQLNSDAENPTFTYTWKPASSSEEASADYLVVSEEDLHKISLEITGTDAYYGTLSAIMYVPEAPEYTITTTNNSIAVELIEKEEKLNTPQTEGYVVELYLGDELVQSQKTTGISTLVFNGLTKDTEYTLKVNSYNVIGRSDIVETNVITVESTDDDIITEEPTEGTDDDIITEEPTEGTDDDIITEEPTEGTDDDIITEEPTENTDQNTNVDENDKFINAEENKDLSATIPTEATTATSSTTTSSSSTSTTNSTTNTMATSTVNTGNDSSMIIWIALLMLSALGIKKYWASVK